MSTVILLLSFLLSTIPAPVRVDDPQCELPWFRGAIPPTPHNTVLVFVHGKHDDETIWFDKLNHYGHNDMYELAYNAGYKTAFVRLGSEATMWYNGRVLAEQLASIERYFNTRNIVIIAHSKGGIDAQAALVYYNSIGAPRKIISLSTPYYGSPLADLLFSNFYVTWLALLIGQATPAAFVLQTAYMYDFQERLSSDPDNQYLYYYTLSGWDIGPFPLWLGGLYLNMHGGDYAHGGNDGAVTFESAHLSAPHASRISLPAYSDHQRKWFFNHFNMPLGDNTWYYIDSLLDVYPVLASYNKKISNFKSYRTIKSTGFIRSSSSEKNDNLEIVIPQNSQVYLVVNHDTKVSLGGQDADNKLRVYDDSGIKYLNFNTKNRQKLSVNGEFFLLVNEGRAPLEVRYRPIVAGTLPHIQIKMEQGSNISYRIVAKVYNMSGNLRDIINLHGSVKNGSSITLPFYSPGLYNLSLVARNQNSERTAIFTILVKDNTEFNHKTENIQTAYINRVENHNIHGSLMDILGRRTKSINKSGIFFRKRGGKNTPIIVIK